MFERTQYASAPPGSAVAPFAIADAAHYSLMLAALRQSARALPDRRLPAVRASRRADEIGDALAAAAAQVLGETGMPGTPRELLAEQHLRMAMRHCGAYLRALMLAAEEKGEDSAQALGHGVAILRSIAQHTRPTGVAQ